MSQKPSKRLRLKDTHPTMVKLNQVLDLADKLGVSVSVENFVTLLHDAENQTVFYMEDADHNGEPVTDFPPALEFNVFMDNPAYLAWEKQETEKRDQERAEAIRLAEEKTKKIREAAQAKRKAEELAAAIALEEKERAELARLKAKFKE